MVLIVGVKQRLLKAHGSSPVVDERVSVLWSPRPRRDAPGRRAHALKGALGAWVRDGCDEAPQAKSASSRAAHAAPELDSMCYEACARVALSADVGRLGTPGDTVPGWTSTDGDKPLGLRMRNSLQRLR